MDLKSDKGKTRLSWERAGECSGAHLRPIPGVGRLRGRAGEGARRHQAAAVTTSSPPAKLRRGRANTRHWRLQGILVKRLWALVVTEMAGGGGSTAAAALAVMAVGLRRGCAWLAWGTRSPA
jgi:hypothetical protein